MPTFSELAWADTASVLQAIQVHPFVVALGDGTLAPQTFCTYMIQDAKYLLDYAKALACLATKTDDQEEIAFWAQSSHGAIVAERQLHAQYVELSQAAQHEKSPTCTAYTSYLVAATSTQPYPIGVAAVLPCFWIYQEVGQTLLDQVADLTDHPYRAWISQYADETFAQEVAQARSYADSAARLAGTPVVEQMLAAYRTAARFEWLFWDAAWRGESWPV